MNRFNQTETAIVYAWLLSLLVMIISLISLLFPFPFHNSTTWRGTVSRTWSGKQCLPWANVTKVQTKNAKYFFPDGSAENASNFCRDPSAKSHTWCYVTQEYTESCDIPTCIRAEKTGSEYPCMVFEKPKNKKFRFVQESCQSRNYGFCTTDNYMLWGHSWGTWEIARDSSRNHMIYSSSKSQWIKCKSIAGPRIFWLDNNHDVDKLQWFGYSREICTVSSIVPRRKPQKCFSVSVDGKKINSEVTDCDSKNSFLCSYAQVTCSHNVNTSLNGYLVTPGYENEGYGNNQRCVWTISVPEDYLINLSIDVSIEDSFMCRDDFLRVFEKMFAEGVSLCGVTKNNFTSTTNNVTVEFRSDGTDNNYKGASITWLAVPKPTPPTIEITTEQTTITKTTLATSQVSSERHSSPSAAGGDSIDGTEGGALEGSTVGIIAGVLVTVCLIFGITCFLIRRRRKTTCNTDKNDNNNSAHGQKKTNLGNNVQTTGQDRGKRPSSEIYQNAVYEHDAMVEIDLGNNHVDENVHASVKDIADERKRESVRYLPKDAQSVGRSKPDDDEEMYNKLNETTGNKHQTQTDSLYNRFNDTQDLYDHSLHTTPSKRQTKVDQTSRDLETYDHLTGDQETYSKVSTLQKKQEKLISVDLETYSNLSNERDKREENIRITPKSNDDIMTATNENTYGNLC